MKIAVRQHNIVARPFPKFFNLDEAIANGEQLPAEDFEVTEKLDGSLGILYWLDGEPRLATRGSFTSDQALVGTKIFQERYGSAYFHPDFTYLFEIIYPANRIVIDYKGMEDSILLAIIETKTGREYSYNDIQKLVGSAFPIVRRYDGITDVHKLKELQGNNQEGFVMHFLSGQRYKVKFDEYVRLHGLVTGVNARTIWDLLRNDQSFDELLERVPDEFYSWVKKTTADLIEKYNLISAKAHNAFIDTV